MISNEMEPHKREAHAILKTLTPRFRQKFGSPSFLAPRRHKVIGQRSLFGHVDILNLSTLK